MDHGTTTGSGTALLLIEAGLTSISVVSAAILPQLSLLRGGKVERWFGNLARRKRLAVLMVGAALLVLRMALLPLFPAPLPNSPGDFSFLLAADTFLHGRLTNPTPAMWTHLEGVHVTMQPSYMSMYFPGPGLLMAASRLVIGHPWPLILITGAMSCAAICWMLQAWLPPGWALLGGFLAVLRIGLFSYWVNSYTGGATLTMLGGALVLGALPRLTKTGRFRYALLMACGVVMLALTRPYEGVLLCLPVAVVLGRWILRGENRPAIPVLLRRAALPIMLIAAALAWLGYYDYRAFGKATTLPYTIDRATYAVAPYYIWQAPHPVPQYRHVEMQRFYTQSEMAGFSQLHSQRGFVLRTILKLLSGVLFFAGFALLPPLLMAGKVIRDRRMRFLVWSGGFWIAGISIGVFLIPHYLAPFTAAVYALGLQGMRHLRQWRPAGAPVGAALVRSTVLVCLLMAGLRIVAAPLHLEPPQWPMGPWLGTWIGPGHFGKERATIESELDHMRGRHLVLVRFASTHEPGDQWVYNGADVENAKTVWAWDMDPESDEELIRHYKDRDVWLVQPDVDHGKLQRIPLMPLGEAE